MLHLLIARTTHAVPLQIEGKDCPGGDRLGAAFAVESPFRDVNGVVVITALHVLAGCRSAEVFVVSCDDVTPRRSLIPLTAASPIHKIGGLDMAVLPVSDAQQARLGTLSKIVSSEPKFDDPKLSIPAASGDHICPRGVGFVHGATTIKRHFQYLKDHSTESDRKSITKIMRVLDGDGRLLSYWGSAAAGASGGPVLHDDKIVAMHQGGFRDRDGGWGILLARDRLINVAVERTTLGAIGTYDLGALVHASSGGMSDHTYLALRDRLTLVELAFHTRWKPLDDGYSLGGSAGASHELFVSTSRRWSIGLAWRLGYFRGEEVQPIFGPDGVEVERPTASIAAYAAELSLFGRVGRIGRAALTVHAGGRTRVTDAESPLDGGVLDASLEAFGRLQVTLPSAWCSATRCAAISVALEGSAYEDEVVDRHQYTGAGAEHVASGHAAGIVPSMEVGVAF